MENERQQNMQITDEETKVQYTDNPLWNMNLMDDFLFDVATADIETCRIIIELSLGIRIREIRWKEGQKVVHNLPGKRGIRMDFYVEDVDGRVFDVEMQKKNEGNIPRRTRYYQALLDAPMLKSGERGFDHLKPAYIIVICGFDLFGYGLYRYTFDNRCKELPELTMGDGCSKIILNTKGRNDTEVDRTLVDFLHYIDHSSEENIPDDCDERLKNLHRKVYEIKTNEQMGVSYMKMEERDRLIREEGERLGEARGEARGKIEGEISVLRKLAAKGYDTEKLAEDLELDRERVDRIMETLKKYGDKSDREIAEMLE
ncbi:MAG TPA: Rpn family recombination-promoting nuclease/putative transposase [Candidatus Mediterraneibacter merdipullorum]|nr:Rpn family recombination-promoting nuclease/putative transposase [Candidatus Mediterraneibacter merdipullorum]